MGRLRDHGLSLFFFAIFVLALAGQAVTGHRLYNEDSLEHGDETISLGRYITSSDFGQAVTENWQSEYLQFTLFLIVTVWLVQRGSTESKPPGQEGRESDEVQLTGSHAKDDSPLWAKVGGFRQKLYENSLLLVMGLIFAGSWFAQSVTGWSDYNSDQIGHDSQTLSWLGYVRSAQFWQSTLENWQSEFLAVGSMAALTIYLRQRGSPQSKPVGAAQRSTGVEG